MNSREYVETAVREAVEDVMGTPGIDKDACLVYRESGIAPVSFLYIFDKLEEKLGPVVYDILKTHTYQVMTIENLADAIFGLCNEDQRTAR